MGVGRIGLGVAAVLVGLAWADAATADIVVGGSLSDWGVTVGDGGQGQTLNVGGNDITFNNASGTNYNGTRPSNFQLQDGVEGIAFGMPSGSGQWSEDIWDGTNSELVDPNWGGQDYDAEWMGAAYTESTNTLFLGILSGVRQDNGFSKFGPGDIRLVAHYGDGSMVEFGIEVGGGVGGSGTSVVNNGGHGSTYRLNSDGSTYKVLTTDGTNETLHFSSSSSQNDTSSCGPNQGGGSTGGYGINEGQVAGSVWRMDGSSWILDPISQSAGISEAGNKPVQIGCGATHEKQAEEFVYKSASGSKHSVIELALNLDFLDNFTDLDIYWGPACGNDLLGILWPRTEASIPAPGGLIVLGSALLGLAAFRRRARK